MSYMNGSTQSVNGEDSIRRKEKHQKVEDHKHQGKGWEWGGLRLLTGKQETE